MCALLPVLAEPPAPSPCAMFWCRTYRLSLTHRGCLDRQAARVVRFGRSWPAHRFCAWSCDQGRAISVQFGVTPSGRGRRQATSRADAPADHGVSV
jgi:hypothetical protein